MDPSSKLPSSVIEYLIHEVKAPLQSLITISRLALSNQGPKDRHLRRIEQQAMGALEWIDQYLNLITGKDALSWSSALDAIQHALETATSRSSNGGSWQLGLDGEVASALIEGPILQQILTNLVSNSFQNGQRDVQIHAKVTSEKLRVRLHDEGPGLPLEIEQSFMHGPGESKNGHGVGLHLCHQLARTVSGTFDYVSSSDQWYFEITLPASKRPQKTNIEAKAIHVLSIRGESPVFTFWEHILESKNVSFQNISEADFSLRTSEGPFELMDVDFIIGDAETLNDLKLDLAELEALPFPPAVIEWDPHFISWGHKLAGALVGSCTHLISIIDQIQRGELPIELARSEYGDDLGRSMFVHTEDQRERWTSYLGDSQKSAGPINLLIIDDDPDTAKLISVYAKKLGASVGWIRSMQTDVSSTPDIILVDRFLGGVDTTNALSDLQVAFPNANILAMSANPSDQVPSIKKPVSFKELQEIFESHSPQVANKDHKSVA